MTKTRLNNTHRQQLRTYGYEKIASLIDRGQEKAYYAQLLDAANTAIRQRYPEEDMAVLRRYDTTHIDRCVKFQFPSGRVDGFYFPSEEAGLADMPYRRHCLTHAAFAVDDEAIEVAFDAYHTARTANDKEQRQRGTVFDAMLQAAKTLEDVMEAVELPAELLERLGRKSTALIALSSDDLKRLKQDFALANIALITEDGSQGQNEREAA